MYIDTPWDEWKKEEEKEEEEIKGRVRESSSITSRVNHKMHVSKSASNNK